MFKAGSRIALMAVVLAGLGVITEARAGFTALRPPPGGVKDTPKEPGGDPPPPVNPPPPVIPPPPIVIPPPVVPPPPHHETCDTPEPATLTLAAIGVAAAAGVNRVRKLRK